MADTTTHREREARTLSSSLAELDRCADALSWRADQLRSSAEGLAGPDPREQRSPAARRTSQVAGLRRALDELDARTADLALSVLVLQSDLARAGHWATAGSPAPPGTSDLARAGH